MCPICWITGFIAALFGGSLLACTFTTQLPSVKTFKLWKFIASSSQYKNLKVNDNFRLGVSNSVAFNCNENQYHFFRQHKKGYA